MQKQAIKPDSDVCPNCGSKLWDEDEGTCNSCFYMDGDDLYCPHWMEYEAWRAGIASGWKLSSRDALKMFKK